MIIASLVVFEHQFVDAQSKKVGFIACNSCLRQVKWLRLNFSQCNLPVFVKRSNSLFASCISFVRGKNVGDG
jgi:hypothetical protein